MTEIVLLHVNFSVRSQGAYALSTAPCYTRKFVAAVMFYVHLPTPCMQVSFSFCLAFGNVLPHAG
jgi:hypothetical protein